MQRTKKEYSAHFKTSNELPVSIKGRYLSDYATKCSYQLLKKNYPTRNLLFAESRKWLP
jgi:hypothetical protein